MWWPGGGSPAATPSEMVRGHAAYTTAGLVVAGGGDGIHHFDWPQAVAIDEDGTLYVLDNGRGQVTRLDPAPGLKVS